MECKNAIPYWWIVVPLICYFLSTGVALTLRHIRNGTELKPIDMNRNYDFEFQQTNYIPRLKLLPVCYIIFCVVAMQFPFIG